MPDGDIFQRSLRGTGRGWASIFRLSAFRGSFYGLEGNISRACSGCLRRIPRELIEQSLTALNRAFDVERFAPNEHGQFRPNVFLTLNQDLRSIRSVEEFELVTLLKDSMKSTFLANQSRASELSYSEISDAVGETLVCRILDSRMSRIRNVLMKESGRDTSEQFVMEREVKSRMVEAGRKLMADFCKGKKFRSPVFRKSEPRKSAVDFLNQPIQILS